MGRLTILFVLGLAFSFGIISYSLNRSNIQTVELTSGYYKYSAARNISRTAINIFLRKKEDTGAFSNLSGNVMGGSYTLTHAKSNDTVRLLSVAAFSDTIYRIRTVMKEFPKPFPNISAAVGIRVDSVNFDMQGNSTRINGNNHDINGNLISPSIPANNKPGVEVMKSVDVANVGSDSSKILGFPVKVNINPNMENPANFIQEYISSADFTLGPGNYNNLNYGSVNSPVIVYANAGLTGEVKVNGNFNGWGVLVVTGKFTVTGDMTWYGLVIPYSTTILDFSTLTGSSKIVGAILMGGANKSTFQMKGSADALYSRDALDKAKMIGKLLAYRIVSWYE